MMDRYDDHHEELQNETVTLGEHLDDSIDSVSAATGLVPNAITILHDGIIGKVSLKHRHPYSRYD